MIKILFSNARPGFPLFFDGGAERSSFSLMAGLVKLGFKLTQICTLYEDSFERSTQQMKNFNLQGEIRKFYVFKGGEKIVQRHLQITYEGILIIAIPKQAFEHFNNRYVVLEKPDVLVTWLNKSQFIIDLGEQMNVPTILRIVDSEGDAYPKLKCNTTVLANSPSSALTCQSIYGRKVGFMIGIVHAENMKIQEQNDPYYITYINPRKEKGLHLFAKIVTLLPDLPFLVVRGWSRSLLRQDEIAALNFLLEQPNVSIIDSVPDIRRVLVKTKLLLLPSRWLESWSRLIGEAQINGIPVIASHRGSNAHSIGKGGLILEYGQPALWARMVRRIYEEESLYRELSRHALMNFAEKYDAVSQSKAFAVFVKSILEHPECPAYPEYVQEFCINKAALNHCSKPMIQAQTVGLSDISFDEPLHP